MKVDKIKGLTDQLIGEIKEIIKKDDDLVEFKFMKRLTNVIEEVKMTEIEKPLGVLIEQKTNKYDISKVKRNEKLIKIVRDINHEIDNIDRTKENFNSLITKIQKTPNNWKKEIRVI